METQQTTWPAPPPLAADLTADNVPAPGRVHVEEAHHRLDNIGARLEALAAGLEDRLNVILRPLAPEPTGPETPVLTRASLAPLAIHLHDQADRLERIFDRLNRLADRIEV